MSLHSFFLQFQCSTQDSACLHLSNFRICISQTTTTVTQHRVVFTQRFYTLLDILQTYAHCIRHLLLSLQIMRNELMQRRIEQTYSHRTARHCFKDTLKVRLLVRENLSQCLATSFSIFCQNHFTHCLNLFTFKEHVFCTAKTDTHRTEVTCNFRIMRSVRIGTYLQTGIFISQCHQFCKVTGKLGSFRLYLTIIYYTRTSVQRDVITFFQHHTVNFHRTCLIVNIQCTSTRHTAFTHTTGYHSSVRSHTSTGSQDTFGDSHTRQVLRRGLDTNHHHTFAGSMPFGSVISEEYNLTSCSTRRSRKTTSQDFCFFQSILVKYRVEQFIQLIRFNAHQGCLFVNHTLTKQIHSNLHHGSTRTFTVTCLEEPKLTFLNGELHVLHIFIVIFQFCLKRIQFVIDFRHSFFHRRIFCCTFFFAYSGQLSPTLGTDLSNLLRSTDTGYYVFTLRVNQVFTIEKVFTCSCVT